MNVLYVIPARKGSKGVPGKNSKLLHGKPLVQYSLETALSLTSSENICLTTDSKEVIQIAEQIGIAVPFIRPEHLATDTAGSREVILHAVEFYRAQGKNYDVVVLLQPTSPFRKKTDVQEMLSLFDHHLDMVVSVKESHDNPYYSMFEENNEGFLSLVKPGNYSRRQDCPKVYTYNGSVYVIRVSSFEKMPASDFSHIKKFVMDDLHSIDIDSPFDWNVAEMILEKKLI